MTTMDSSLPRQHPPHLIPLWVKLSYVTMKAVGSTPINAFSG
ncbi:MAG: hypothetical protein NTY19_48390 [Planctomycetota bacterium]|nr:hypothetical protein [Planctomycetota bacterium]